MSRPGLALAVVLILGCGGALEGDVVREPVADWSFVEGAEDVAFSAGGKRFTTALAGPIVHAGALYLSVSTVLPFEDGGLEAVLAGEGVRMRAGGRIYELAATHLTEAAEIDPILPTVLEAAGYEAEGARWDPTPKRYPGTQIARWFFRLESATPAP